MVLDRGVGFSFLVFQIGEDFLKISIFRLVRIMEPETGPHKDLKGRLYTCTAVYRPLPRAYPRPLGARSTASGYVQR